MADSAGTVHKCIIHECIHSAKEAAVELDWKLKSKLKSKLMLKEAPAWNHVKPWTWTETRTETPDSVANCCKGQRTRQTTS